MRSFTLPLNCTLLPSPSTESPSVVSRALTIAGLDKGTASEIACSHTLNARSTHWRTTMDKTQSFFTERKVSQPASLPSPSTGGPSRLSTSGIDFVPRLFPYVKPLLSLGQSAFGIASNETLVRPDRQLRHRPSQSQAQTMVLALAPAPRPGRARPARGVLSILFQQEELL